MKRKVYISLFTILGILISFLLHAAIELPAIHYLLKDFSRYGLGLTWDQWVMIHNVSSVILFLTGALMGFLEGRRWWRIIYIERALNIKY